MVENYKGPEMNFKDRKEGTNVQISLFKGIMYFTVWKDSKKLLAIPINQAKLPSFVRFLKNTVKGLTNDNSEAYRISEFKDKEWSVTQVIGIAMKDGKYLMRLSGRTRNGDSVKVQVPMRPPYGIGVGDDTNNDITSSLLDFIWWLENMVAPAMALTTEKYIPKDGGRKGGYSNNNSNNSSSSNDDPF
jgi:hypothetical protein